MFSKDSSRIREMFNSVADRYDVVNDLLSLGLHRLWKKRLVTDISPNDDVPFETLDCATGTGDIAVLIQKTFPRAKVTAIDFSEKMIERAPAKAESAGLKNIRFITADILSMPFSENSFDHITVSFGIRNVENLLDAIAEFERVLKPGGRLHVLEFGQPQNPTWSKVYSAYHRNVLPFVGGVITGNMQAYSYLNKSSEEFPAGSEFMKQFPGTSWKSLEMTPLMGAVAYIYRLQKL